MNCCQDVKIENKKYIDAVKFENFTLPWDHSFSGYAKFSEKLTFLPPETHMYLCVSGGKKVSFSENFTYVLKE